MIPEMEINTLRLIQETLLSNTIYLEKQSSGSRINYQTLTDLCRAATREASDLLDEAFVTVIQMEVIDDE